jgi:hypothetical protein
MSSIARDSEPSDAASLDRVPALSELPQFFRRIAQYHQEFIIYDDGFRGCSCVRSSKRFAASG